MAAAPSTRSRWRRCPPPYALDLRPGGQWKHSVPQTRMTRRRKRKRMRKMMEEEEKDEEEEGHEETQGKKTE
eukprot:8055606-Pyramimonas_sp.AAC.1